MFKCKIINQAIHCLQVWVYLPHFLSYFDMFLSLSLTTFIYPNYFACQNKYIFLTLLFIYIRRPQTAQPLLNAIVLHSFRWFPIIKKKIYRFINTLHQVLNYLSINHIQSPRSIPLHLFTIAIWSLSQFPYPVFFALKFFSEYQPAACFVRPLFCAHHHRRAKKFSASLLYVLLMRTVQ